MSTEIAQQQQGVAKAQSSPSERFTTEVLKQYISTAGDVQVSNFQKKLIQNYFVKLDATLKENEIKRMAKKEEYRDALAFTWENVNMQKLSVDVIAFSMIGLDPVQSNHINLVCYKNSHTSKFDIGFLPGYRGMEIKAKKYGLEIPDDVIVELVYSNDTFKPIKKDLKNRVESYNFDITEAFDRGDLIGGFYYHSFFATPEKNKLRMLTLKDIEKRKPKSASAEFWGGTKPIYENGKKTNKTEAVEGWFDEMAWKTIYRAAYSDITIDSEKIDEHFLKMIEVESDKTPLLESPAEKAMMQIQEKGNKELTDFEDVTGKPEPAKIEAKKEEKIPSAKINNDPKAGIPNNPGF